METISEAIESYINGNIGHVRLWLIDSQYTSGDFIREYIEIYSPTNTEIIRAINWLQL